MTVSLCLDCQCPAGMSECPILTAYLRLEEECRRLTLLSQIDALTGLYNRAYLFEALAREMERTRRTAAPTGLVMLDLDLFKQVNDNFGHQGGDAVLHAVGRFLRRSVRKLDIACRYGGEEFVLILPGTRLAQAIRLAERLRGALPGEMIMIAGCAVHLTASFGVAAFQVREDLSPEGFLQRADAALLEAKAQGRNRVCSQSASDDQGDMELGAAERAALRRVKKSSSSSSSSRCRS